MSPDDLEVMTDQEILDCEDPLKLARLSALMAKRAARRACINPKLCTANFAAIWAVIAFVVGVIVKHVV